MVKRRYTAESVGLNKELAIGLVALVLAIVVFNFFTTPTGNITAGVNISSNEKFAPSLGDWIINATNSPVVCKPSAVVHDSVWSVDEYKLNYTSNYSGPVMAVENEGDYLYIGLDVSFDTTDNSDRIRVYLDVNGSTVGANGIYDEGDIEFEIRKDNTTIDCNQVIYNNLKACESIRDAQGNEDWNFTWDPDTNNTVELRLNITNITKVGNVTNITVWYNDDAGGTGYYLPSYSNSPVIDADTMWDNYTISNDTTLYVSGNLIIENNGNLTMDGCTLFMNSSYDGNSNYSADGLSRIEVQSGGKLLLNNTTIAAGSGNGSANFLFWLGGSTDIRNSNISDVGFNYSGTDRNYSGIWLTSSHSNTFIMNSTFTRNFMSIVGIGSNIYIENNTFRNNDDAGIWSHDLSDDVGNLNSNWTIKNNTIKDNLYGIIITDQQNNNTIENNTILSNTGGPGINLTNTKNNIVTYNHIDGNSGDGILLVRANDSIIEYNNISVNYNGINSTLSTNNSIKFNNATSNDYDGYSDNYGNSTYWNNSAHSNAYSGFALLGADNNTIINGTLEKNTFHGFNISSVGTDYPTNNTIRLIDALSNTRNGFYINSYNNTFENITANSNSWNGVVVEYENNTFRNGNANSNSLSGFNLSDSSAINNTIQFFSAALNSLEGFFINAVNNTFDNATANSNTRNGILLNVGNNSLRNITTRSNTLSGVNISSGSENSTIHFLNSSSNLLEGLFINGNNNTIINATLDSNSLNGLFLQDADNNTIKNVISTFNVLSGFNISFSDNNTFTNNTAQSNTRFGFWLLDSIYEILSGNLFLSNTDKDIHVNGTDVQFYNHSIDRSNKVDGEPILYYYNSSDVTIDGVVTNSIIIANSTGFVVQNVNVSEYDAIYLFQVNSSTFDNISANNTGPYGIWALRSFFNEFKNVTTGNNSIASFYFNGSQHNVIDNSSLHGGLLGVALNNSRNITVANSTFTSLSSNETALDGASYDVVFLNNSFNKANIFIVDANSNASIKWFVNVSVVNTSYQGIGSAGIAANNTANSREVNVSGDAAGTYIAAVTELNRTSSGNTTYTPFNITGFFTGYTTNTSNVTPTGYSTLALVLDVPATTTTTTPTTTTTAAPAASSGSSTSVVNVGGGDPGTVKGTVRVILPDKETNFEIESDDNPITRIALTTNGKLTGVSLLVTPVNELSSGTPKVSLNSVYTYVKVNETNIHDDNLTTTNMYFNVPVSWVMDNNINPRNIIMMRLTSGVWLNLPTSLLEITTTKYKFVAESPGLSLFAIAVGEDEPIPVNATTTTVGPTTTIGNVTTTTMGPGLELSEDVIQGIFVVILLAVLGAVWFFMGSSKHKKTRR